MWGIFPGAPPKASWRNFSHSTGQVLGCRIITERSTGRSRGYGFVEVNEDEMEEIMEKTNGADLDGRKIVVNEAKPREES